MPMTRGGQLVLEERLEERVLSFADKWKDLVTGSDERTDDEKKLDASIEKNMDKNFLLGRRLCDDPQWPFNVKTAFDDDFWFTFLVYVAHNPGFSVCTKNMMVSLIRTRFHALPSVNRANEMYHMLESALRRNCWDVVQIVLKDMREEMKRGCALRPRDYRRQRK